MTKKTYISHAGYIGAVVLIIGAFLLIYLHHLNIISQVQNYYLFILVASAFSSMLIWEYFSKRNYNKQYPPKNNLHIKFTNQKLFKSTFFRFIALFLPFYVVYYIINNHNYFIHNHDFELTILFYHYFLIMFITLGPIYLFLTLKYKNAPHYEYNDYAILTMIGIKSLFCQLFCKKKVFKFYKNRRVKKVLLVYLVNFFFIALMIRFLHAEFISLDKHINILLSDAYIQGSWYMHARNWYFICFHGLFIIDTGLAMIGYSFASRWLDNRTKSIDTTAFGWFVAIACYPPFNNLISDNFIYYHSLPTHEIITSQIVWSILFIVLLIAYSIFVWATMAFGFKFSNLTNRGIITHGPYKYVRHPAYTAKNIAWFIDSTYVLTNIWASLAFFAWSSIYILRALTEEIHLQKDKAYQRYQKKVPYKFIPKII